MIIKNAETFSFLGGDADILLGEGFTNTKEILSTEQYFVERGFSAPGVHLTGQATHPDIFAGIRYQDWLSSKNDLLLEIYKKYIQ